MNRSERVIAEIRERIAKSTPVASLIEEIGNGRAAVTGMSLEARGATLAAITHAHDRKLLIVVPNDAVLRDLHSVIALFHEDPECVATYPSPSLSPYQSVDTSLAVARDEIRGLEHLVEGKADVLIVPARALFRRLPSPESLASRVLRLRVDEEIDTRAVMQALVDGGFTRNDLVGEAGEFAWRGGIIDVFAPNLDRPVRIELFGDTIDSIRFFETDTQRSAESLNEVVIYPLTQFPADREHRQALARKLSVDFQDPRWKRDLAARIEELEEHGRFPGMEHALPLVSESTGFGRIIEHPQPRTLVLIEPEEIRGTITKYAEVLRQEYETAAEEGRAVWSPEELLVPADEILDVIDAAPLAFTDIVVGGSGWTERRITAPAARNFINALSEVAPSIEEVRSEGATPVILRSTRGGGEKIHRLLTEFSVPFVEDSATLGASLVVANGSLPQGFRFPAARVVVWSEWDLFEPPRTSSSARRRRTDVFLTDLRDLKPGDLIVHLDHGIGRFLGLRRIAFGDTEREVMELEYSNAGKLLLPMESLDLIQKYQGGADLPPKLDKLGGTSWARTKASVKKAMRDMADELLRLYATRQMVQGHSFGSDTPWQQEFEESFEFDETEDQIYAIEDIKRDMESPKPMDRLLCGDVGYGKTEVAMRAAFKAVMDGRQVAVLAPTTILAYQHYRTFLRRMASFPVTIELMSRYRSPKEQKAITEKIAAGEIDIVIGTHRILSKDMAFRNLGLLIIDEEQRFGVAQKERLKQFKKSIDVLAMSATPIPRTLNMSMVGIRDISVIETPPKDRLAIQTAVVPFKDDLIREAIEFELTRGGQVFFLHNRVDSIYGMKEYLEKVVPGLRVTIGHGQMNEQELERVMEAFIRREHDVLLATTIIENGIDIPSCNTILINHAERFGLSQLYQLRGRVGRSDRLAFCYLLVPNQRALSSDARKRLAAIQEFSDLGAGFRIAARDLEIRGAGNLLGGEQSGQIAAVGFEMYTKLLEETVRELRGEKVEEEVETSMNLALDIYIPKDYIQDETLRMTFYKRIASARDQARLDDIREEMRDRFGAIPPAVETLFDFVALRRQARELGIVSIARDQNRVAIKFHPQAKIDPHRLMELLQQRPELRFSPGGVLSIGLQSPEPVLDTIGNLLSAIAA